jgi:CRP-like cAMP-binding protein
MGSGASAENAVRTVASVLDNKPADASDIKDLDGAKEEIRQLRKIALEFQNQLREEAKAKDGAGGGGKRQAVVDNQKMQTQDKDYVAKVVDKPADIRQMLLGIVSSNVLFSSYTYDEHNAIVDAFDTKKVGTDEFVIRQGESGDNFYVIESGAFDVFVKNASGEPQKVGNTLGKGNAFGELALMYNTPRAASIKSLGEGVVWTIDRHTYRQIVVQYKYLRNKQYLGFLKEVEIMGKKLGNMMTEVELEKMVISLEREVFQPGDAIIRQGNTGDHFYIIAEGDVGVFKTDQKTMDEKKLTVLHKGAYFGEQALLKEDVRQASCIAEGRVICLTLAREDFIEMMGSIEDMVANKPREAAVEVSAGDDVNGADKFALDIQLSDLEIRSTLGCGAFGRVKLCRYPAKDQMFALKCQAKRAIVENGLQEHVLNEMRVMRKIDHPFIAKLFVALQDNKYIYFVLELLLGGELFTHLRNKGKLSEKSATFYAATVVYAYSTLHAKKIAYRDLKPENLVMDVNGYVK